jgi:hypothetical protein
LLSDELCVEECYSAARAEVPLSGEKGADSDLVRKMVRYVAQRMMAMDVEGLCAAAYAVVIAGDDDKHWSDPELNVRFLQT